MCWRAQLCMSLCDTVTWRSPLSLIHFKFCTGVPLWCFWYPPGEAISTFPIVKPQRDQIRSVLTFKFLFPLRQLKLCCKLQSGQRLYNATTWTFWCGLSAKLLQRMSEAKSKETVDALIAAVCRNSSVDLQVSISTQHSQRPVVHCPALAVVITWVGCCWTAMAGGDKSQIQIQSEGL